MKRSEFVDEINSWDELLDFCRDYGLETCMDIYTNGDVDEIIEDDVSERDCGWYELMEALNGIPTDGLYYRRFGWLDYVCVDDNFVAWKQSVLEDCDYMDDFWDSEIDLEEDDESVFDPVFDEDCDDMEGLDRIVDNGSEPSLIVDICKASLRIIS